MKISRYIASYWNIVKYRLYRKKTVLLKGDLDNSQVFTRTKEPALIKLLPAAIQSQQLEQHLLIPLHSREEVEGDFALHKSEKHQIINHTSAA